LKLAVAADGSVASSPSLAFIPLLHPAPPSRASIARLHAPRHAGTKSKSIAAHSRQSNSKRKVDYSYGDQTDEGTSHSSDDQTDEEDQIAPLATKTLSTRPRDEVDDGGYSSSSSDGSLGSMDTGSCSSDDVGNRMSAGSEDSQDKTLVDDEVGSYDDDEGPRSITE
jgi:hypothetical protein